MSSIALGAVFSMRGITAREFRMLTCIANNDDEQWSFVSVEDLAQFCELDAESCVRSFVRMAKRIFPHGQWSIVLGRVQVETAALLQARKP